MPLSVEQELIINEKHKNLVTLAGPGTGKSFTILGKIKDLIKNKGVTPDNIFVLTFTRAATKELKTEVKKLVNDKSKSLNVFTLHGFSLRQLVKNADRIDKLPKNFKIANDYEERFIIMEDLKRMLKIDRIDEVKKLFQRLSANWETLNADTQDWEISFDNPEFISAWRQHRSVYGYVLRVELVYQLKKVLEQKGDIKLDGPINYLIVDEYQDLNKCDLEVIKNLSIRGASLFCAGDDDQSIYEFRYAYPEGIRNFTKDYEDSKQCFITECRRCDKKILDLADKIIRQDLKRIPKKLVPTSEQDGEVHLLNFSNQNDEAEKVSELVNFYVNEKKIESKEIIILLRTDRNSTFSAIIKEKLIGKGIVVNESAAQLEQLSEKYGRKYVSVIKYIIDKTSDLAIRTIFELTKGLGPSTYDAIFEISAREDLRFHQVVEKIVTGEIANVRNKDLIISTLNSIKELEEKIKPLSITESVDRILEFIGDAPEDFKGWLLQEITKNEIEDIDSFVQYIDDILGPIEQPDAEVDGLRIMTMHKAKGLSAKVVFVIGCEEEYMPGKGSIEEERRLLYVSVTRARNSLFLTYCNDRVGFQSFRGFLKQPTSKRNLTRFLSDIPSLKSEEGIKFTAK